MRKLKPREIAINVLKAAPGTDFIEDRLDSSLAKADLTGPDRGLVQELVYGVVRWQAALDWLIARKSKNPAQKTIVQILLRLGLYQLLWLDRIPNYAAVNETVQLAKTFGAGPQAGFINALLRGYEREKAEAKQSLQELKRDQPATGYSHPEWLCERWESRWGRHGLIDLLEWNNSIPDTYARLNSLRTDRASLTSEWTDEKVAFSPVAWDWVKEGIVFRLDDYPALGRLRSLNRGAFYVQDPSTLLAVDYLDPKPGESVLDLCAAPGGKTAYIAQRMRNYGRIVATDPDPARLRRLEENCARLGATCVQIVPWPLMPEPQAELWDRILVDAPCSNTGVMRRRLELRGRLRAEELLRLQRTQLDILERAAPQLKSEGCLIYSTCSLEPEENELVVQNFLGKHTEYALESQRQLVPFQDRVDGAFVARLKRK